MPRGSHKGQQKHRTVLSLQKAPVVRTAACGVLDLDFSGGEGSPGAVQSHDLITASSTPALGSSGHGPRLSSHLPTPLAPEHLQLTTQTLCCSVSGLQGFGTFSPWIQKAIIPLVTWSLKAEFQPALLGTVLLTTLAQLSSSTRRLPSVLSSPHPHPLVWPSGFPYRR